MIECSLPPDINSIHYENADVMWHFSYDLTFFNAQNNKKAIRIDFSNKLYLKNDPEEKPIALIKISNLFTVTRNINPEAKLFLLCNFLDITLCNLQGIYALNTEGTPLAGILPPVMSFKNHSEHLNKRIYYDWK